jgi:hypothetical protein
MGLRRIQACLTDDRVRKETLEHLSSDILDVKIMSMGV